MKTKRWKVIVAGDVNMDWGLVPLRPLPAAEPAGSEPRRPYDGDFKIVQEHGGAWLIYHILRTRMKVAGQAVDKTTVFPAPIEGEVSYDTGLLHNLSVLNAFPRIMEAGHDGRQYPSREKVYRVERIYGQQDRRPTAEAASFGTTLQALETAVPGARLLVLCDLNRGFRKILTTKLVKSLFKPLAESTSPPAILWATRNPLEPHPLWNALSAYPDLARQTIVTLSAASLRDAGVNLHDNLSLERCAADFLTALKREPLWRFHSCGHVVVRLGIDAALVWANCYKMPNKHGDPEVSLFFRPLATGDYYQADLGIQVGYSALFAGLLAHQVALTEGSIEPRVIGDGVKEALHFCRRHFIEGMGPCLNKKGNEQPPQPHWYEPLLVGGFDPKDDAIHDWPLCPVDECRGARWSLLIKALGDETAVSKEAHSIVKEGLKQVRERVPFPVVQLAKLTTADRGEIESYRSIQNLMRKYLRDREWSRPLSIAVFGPPGCGKSFGIQQVAESVASPKASLPIQQLEYNLSQFARVADLATAFHQARDVALSGKIPLVFFDEFDSAFDGRPFGWLKNFLSPMQDGVFRDGQTDFHIWRAILVFVGGLNRSYQELAGRLRSQDFHDAKGPDFVSRLRGFVDVKGPDPSYEGETVHKIRRAIILHGLLRRKMPFLFTGDAINIGDDVVRALLDVSEYKHGIRSMEAILDMSLPSAARRTFQKGDIPPEGQLEMHVNAQEFKQKLQALVTPG